MAAAVKCKVCDAEASTFGSIPPNHMLEGIRCPVCGPYQFPILPFTEPFAKTVPPMELGQLHGVLHAYAESHPGHLFPQVISPESWRGIVEASGAPTDHAERVDVLLRQVARLAPRFGELTKKEPLRLWKAKAYTTSFEELVSLLQAHEDWFMFAPRQPAHHESIQVGLLRAGWDRLRAIRESRTESRTVFVANWAHPKLRTIVEDAIVAGVLDAGLRAEVGNNIAPKAGLVDDGILAGIRRARLLVADLTGCRGGVYFEAGFARGLGVPIIFTCNESMQSSQWVDEPADARHAPLPLSRTIPWVDALHFDVNHYPVLRWADPKALRDGVVHRIRAWGLAAPGHEGGPTA